MATPSNPPRHRLVITANIDILTNDSSLQVRITSSPSFEYEVEHESADSGDAPETPPITTDIETAVVHDNE